MRESASVCEKINEQLNACRFGRACFGLCTHLCVCCCCFFSFVRSSFLLSFSVFRHLWLCVLLVVYVRLVSSVLCTHTHSRSDSVVPALWGADIEPYVQSVGVYVFDHSDRLSKLNEIKRKTEKIITELHQVTEQNAIYLAILNRIFAAFDIIDWVKKINLVFLWFCEKWARKKSTTIKWTGWYFFYK